MASEVKDEILNWTTCESVNTAKKEALAASMAKRTEENKNKEKGNERDEERVALNREFEKMISEIRENSSTDAIKNLERFLGDKMDFMAKFDVKKVQNEILQLKKSAEAEKAPKKKFGFKKNKKVEMKNSPHPEAVKNSPNSETLKEEEKFFGGVNEGLLEIAPSASSGQDVLIKNCAKSTIKVSGSPSTVHVADCNDCVVVVQEPVRTSLFVDDCSGSFFRLEAQQARIHRTRDTEFHLGVTSRAIIEDCHGVGFAPYVPGEDPGDLEARIDDFNWLSIQEKSPHWFIVPEADRKRQWPGF